MVGRQAGLTQRPRLSLFSACSPRRAPTAPNPETYKACSPSRRLGVGSASQPLGKADLEDIFSGVVSMELGPSPGPKGKGEGKTTWTGLCSVADL